MTFGKILIALAIFSLAASNCFAADSYKISTNLLHNNKSFAAPSVVVKSDTPATLEVAGLNGYKVSFTVTDLAPDKIKVAASVESQHGAIAPIMVVRPGQEATVSVGDLGLTLTVVRTGS